jgi:hypothetical protein
LLPNIGLDALRGLGCVTKALALAARVKLDRLAKAAEAVLLGQELAALKTVRMRMMSNISS